MWVSSYSYSFFLRCSSSLSNNDRLSYCSSGTSKNKKNQTHFLNHSVRRAYTHLTADPRSWPFPILPALLCAARPTPFPKQIQNSWSPIWRRDKNVFVGYIFHAPVSIRKYINNYWKYYRYVHTRKNIKEKGKRIKKKKTTQLNFVCAVFTLSTSTVIRVITPTDDANTTVIPRRLVILFVRMAPNYKISKKIFWISTDVCIPLLKYPQISGLRFTGLYWNSIMENW